MNALVTSLDHLVVLTNDLEAASLSYGKILGLMPSWSAKFEGGESTAFTLANTTIELMAPEGQGKAAARIRTALEAQGEGLASLCFRATDIARLHRRLGRLGLKPEAVTASSSVDDASGQQLSGRRTRADTMMTHGVRLFFIEREADWPQSKPTSDAAMTALDHVVVATPDPERAAALYGARLGLDMRLDLTAPDWGSRLMFFRCGDLIIEIAHNLRAGVSSGPDRFFGLSWRCADIEACRERLVQAGFDVSDVRKGRKPGTSVFTLRDGACNVPTIIIGPAAPSG